MAVRIVHGLEMIEVDDERRQPGIGLTCPFDELGELVVQTTTVVEASELVGMREHVRCLSLLARTPEVVDSAYELFVACSHVAGESLLRGDEISTGLLQKRT